MFQNLFSQPLFQPSFLNVNFFFQKILDLLHAFRFGTIGTIIYTASYLVTFFGITITIYSIVRLFEIQKEEYAHLQHEIHEALQGEEERASGKNTRWEHIMDLVSSPNESDWRLAIIEADTVLEGLLEARGFAGDSIGEMLKNSAPGNFGSIQAAWEAHLVRNRIAHEGSEYDLSQRDARRTIQLYEVVFRELGFL